MNTPARWRVHKGRGFAGTAGRLRPARVGKSSFVRPFSFEALAFSE
jgi:hypothetical protein